MKKVISLVLFVLMLCSMFTVLPSASAAETYVAGTEVKVIVSLPNTDAFTAVDGTVTYGSSLEYVADSLALPHVADATTNTSETGVIYFNASSATAAYDISADNVLLTANFTVLEDTSAIDVVTAIDEIFVLDGTTMNDVDATTETTIEVVSAPTEPTTESTTPSEEETEATEPEVPTEGVSIYGDINLTLTAEDDGLYSGTINIDEGTYEYRVSVEGTPYCYGGTFTDTVSVPYYSQFKAATTFIATGGKYTFTFNTNTNVLRVTFKPYSELVELFGDINIELFNSSGSMYTGSVRLDAGSYQFRVKEFGVQMCFGYTFEDHVYEIVYNADWTSATTFNATGGLYTIKYDTDANALTVQHAVAGLGDVRIFGDINLDLAKESDTLYSATTVLEAGTYAFRIDEMGTTMCFGGEFTESIYKVEYRSTWKSSTSFTVEKSKYLFRYDSETNQLTVLCFPIEEKVSIFGDIELELTKGSDGVTYTGKIDLEAGTYAFRVDEMGTTMCFGGTVTDGINATYSSSFVSATTFNATGGTYYFQYNTETDKLLVTKVS